MPTSTEPGSECAASAGSVRSFQKLHGHAGVLRLYVTGAAMALPARSWTPAIVATYAVFSASGPDGVNVSVNVPEE